jgi:superfamily II DNA helicase RecQ
VSGRSAPVDWDSQRFPRSVGAREPRGAAAFLECPRIRSLQLPAVNATLSGRDVFVFVVMPTGAGKSLVYRLPAVVQQGELTVVIRPLLSLSCNPVASLQRQQI